MKHIGQIQTEFLKTAAGWKDWSAEAQREYLKEHPKSKRRFTVKKVPEAIKATILGERRITIKSPNSIKQVLVGEEEAMIFFHGNMELLTDLQGKDVRVGDEIITVPEVRSGKPISLHDRPRDPYRNFKKKNPH